MVRHILVALGCNPESDMALTYADRLANRLGASVVALHIAQEDLIPASCVIVKKYIEIEAEKARERMGEKMAELRQKDMWDRVIFRMTRGANPARELLQELERGAYDLLIIGHRERQNVKKLFLGSVSSQVVEHASVSVLVVKQLLGPSRILFCTDGSRYAEEAIRFGGELMAGIGCPAEVLNVSPWMFDHCERVAQGIAERGAKILSDLGVEVAVKFRLGKDVVKEISKEIKEGKFDLVVAGSRGISGVTRLLLGSITLKLINQTRCPILVYKRLLEKMNQRETQDHQARSQDDTYKDTPFLTIPMGYRY